MSPFKKARSPTARGASARAEPERFSWKLARDVSDAEAQIPLAMADAFRSGNMGIMDYMKMKNVQADTSMRETIAGAPRGTEGGK